MSSYRNVAVIGGSGLLGASVVRELAKAGFDVTLVSRNSGKAKSKFIAFPKIKYIEAESSDPQALKEAFKGIFAIQTSHSQGSMLLFRPSVRSPWAPR